MLSKKQKMMRRTSLAVTAGLKDVLMKDFSEALAAQIIKQNYLKHGLKSDSFNNGGKTEAVNSIVSDYKAIKPIGSVSVVQLKQDLDLAMK